MGCVHVVDVNQLLTLPEHFVRIPVQVVEVYVCGVRPCDRDQDWPEEVCLYVVCLCLCPVCALRRFTYICGMIGQHWVCSSAVYLCEYVHILLHGVHGLA